MNIGHLEKRKNQSLIIDIANSMKHKRGDFLFALVGKGEDFDKLQDLIRKNDLTDYVVLLGHHENVIPVLKSADIYLHTALNENCPLVILEAIAAGVPVVSLAVGGIPELLQQQDVLFHPQSTPETIASALSILLEDTEKRESIQSEQYADGIRNFDIQTMTQNYMAYYQRIIKHANHRNAAATPEVLMQKM